MAHKDDMAEDLDIFFDEDDFGGTGDYTSREAGVTVPVRFIVDFGQVSGSDKVVSKAISASAQVQIPRSDLPSPAKYGDKLNIDGREWQVVKQVGGDSLVVAVELRTEPKARYQK